MKYTITEVMPGQIRVKYEDNSRAIVSILPNASLEDIDHEVSKYDPDFIKKPEDLINPNTYVGQQRVSTKKENKQPTQVNSNLVDPPNSILLTSNIRIGPFVPSRSDIANYYAKKGDTRLQDALDSIIEMYTKSSNFSLDELIANANNNNSSNPSQVNGEDIFAQAQAELEAEKSN